MSLIIAGERSGVGKTTITLALLAALSQRTNGIIQSFKVGPDYIDPMFHQQITGRACRNLDPILTSETYVQACYSRHCFGVDAVVIEGVMGLFDGVHDPNFTQPWDRGSTAHIAYLLNLPIVLVVNASGTSRSLAALVHGYQSYAPALNIVGVILNRVSSPRHLELLETALALVKMPILGVFYRQADITIPDRHLGLVPTAELPELGDLLLRLGTLGQASFIWDLLLPLLPPDPLQISTSQPESWPPETLSPTPSLNPVRFNCHQALPCRLAIAQDAAFSFYYADNLDILHALGFELVAWSPLRDPLLPADIHGLYLGGGFPEVFAAQLSANQSLLQDVYQRISQGLPTYAECGGLMYLCQAIVDFEENVHPMVGILPTTAVMGPRLTLGYRQVHTYLGSEGGLIVPGESICGHEFHRSTLTKTAPTPLYQLRNLDGTGLNVDGWQLGHVFASYVHLHFGGCPQVPQRLWQMCLSLSERIRCSFSRFSCG